MKSKINPYADKQDSIRKDFELVERFTHLLDEKFTIPGTNFRFGIDPIINLVPFFGDIVGFVLSGSLVFIMARNGASPKLIIKMLLNVLLDVIIGGLPLIGKIGDFFFKANTKNLALLKSHYYEGKHQGSGIGIIITILVVFFSILFVCIYLLYKAFQWSYDLLF